VASGGNGHWYEMSGYQANWAGAKSGAESMTHLGMPGYLVTITSQAEQDFAYSVTGGAWTWIGATDDAAQGTVEGQWIWATGPEAGGLFWPSGGAYSYANWFAGSPNNFGPEHYANMQPDGTWDDVRGTSTRTFLIEYGTGVPEPATLGLLGVGGIAILRRRSRQAKTLLKREEQR